ncbi:MAG: hypothetical protein JWP25_7709 [Bradyrhizobium sp.]|nr:hypothetical protein [Bradyrhizobium sp.]
MSKAGLNLPSQVREHRRIASGLCRLGAPLAIRAWATGVNSADSVKMLAKIAESPVARCDNLSCNLAFSADSEHRGML